MAAGSDLEVLGVEPEIGKLALKRSVAEGLDALVELADRSPRRGSPSCAADTGRVT
jgi:hypothetical protein